MFLRFKKFILVFLAVLIFIAYGGTFVRPAPAYAQFEGAESAFSSAVGSLSLTPPVAPAMPTAEVSSIPQATKGIMDTIVEGIKAGALSGVIHAASYAIRKMAYDSAVWLASGGKGQSPFAHMNSFGDYISDVADGAAGSFIEQLGAPLGLNLCQIPDLRTSLNVRLGLRMSLVGLGAGPNGSPPIPPSCTLSQFKQNWGGDAWKSQYGGDALTKDFNASLMTEDSDLGIQVQASQKIGALIDKATLGETLQRQEGGGAIAKVAEISNKFQTPAALIMEGWKTITPDKQFGKDQQTLDAMLANGDWHVFPGMAAIFLENLASQMVQNYQTKGVLPFDDGAANQYGSGSSFTGVQAAQQLFNDFLTVTIRNADNYNLTGELSNCDGNGLYNCRADSGLVQALQQSASKVPVTIADALQKGWLHPDWQLIPPARKTDNTDKNFCQNAYCYSNIAVLKQARILPLGFEIAALNSDPDHPYTLGDVVKGFNDCAFNKDSQGNIVGVQYDPANKPFCHLIDPSWVLKAPQSRCNALVNSAVPLGQGIPDRLQDCADLSSCVAYNSDGTCRDFAYCTREKNTWRFSAQTCDAQFATCRTFRDGSGSSASYLYRTLDTGFCTADTAGCRAYSLGQDSGGKWDPANSIFFNSKVSNACSANSAGCSAFIAASSTDATPLYIRKAPDYLGCYNSNPSSKTIVWPKTVADLAKIQGRPECSNYSAACIPDEVGCNWYTPVDGNVPPIPGKYDSSDVCPASCNGYASYREMPSHYSAGADVSYIIPSSGSVCKAADEGCSSFTNLSATSGGLEQTEYFSYLRPCVTPSMDKGKVFVTYEGSVQGGYQIKTYTLVADATGGPKYFYSTPADKQAFDSVCSEASYKGGAASIDCRQFNDQAGHVYYRLLAQTIPVDNACVPYRLNTADLATIPAADAPDQPSCTALKGFWNTALGAGGQCQVCFQGGEYRNGSCYYYGLPGAVNNPAGASRACDVSVDTCRAYKGNNGNNIREMVSDDFNSVSTTTLINWTGNVHLAPESTRVGGHSLEFAGGDFVARKIAPPLTIGKSYDLTFWAKGTGSSVTVSLLNDESHPFRKDFGAVGVGNVWKLYHIGPVEFSNAVMPILSTNGLIGFQSDAANGAVFLDKVRLVENTGLLYLVKNTLKVPKECDSHPNDNLPGEMLGCTGYKTPDNIIVYLTNFSFLCRENAIGCTAVYDTHNAVKTPGPLAYNVWLSGASGPPATKIVNGNTYSCTIPVGQAGCYTNVTGATKDDIAKQLGPDAISQSTVYIQPPTPAASPIYLVNNPTTVCSSADVGCTYAGAEKTGPNGPAFDNVLIKNNPDDSNYSSQLCLSQAVGCGSYSSGSGNLYFKDPSLTGQKICSYRTNVSTPNGTMNGWFWKNVGVCSNDATIKCSGDGDCGAGNTCQNIGDQPCYPNYLQGGTSFGLWSYGNTGQYQNFVGECPAAQDACTEFRDHNDAPNGVTAAYYLINKKINDGDCGGMAGLKDGCVLLDQTDNPNKYWSTALTYRLSAADDAVKVKPAIDPNSDPAANTNDANRILKVQRDRVCGEWLQCRSSHRVWDQAGSRWKNVCDDIGSCDRATPTNNKNTLGVCAEWNDRTHDTAQIPLTQDFYVTRDTKWKGMDFSGYSLLGLFPLNELTQINVADQTNPGKAPDWRLVETVSCGGDKGVNCDPAQTNLCANGNDGNPCGIDGSAVCVNGLCVKNINNQANASAKTAAPAQICRAYPEKDSPFPHTVAITSNMATAVSGYTGVHYCNETARPTNNPSKANLCECDYTKADYGGAAKYWNFLTPNSEVLAGVGSRFGVVPDGICQGGSQDGHACTGDKDCYRTDSQGATVMNQATNPPAPVIDGSCQLLKKSTRFIGWRGYCLEPDISAPLNGTSKQFRCLTWLPIDNLQGTADVNNQHAEAGFVGSAQYCLKANLFNTPNDNTDVNAPYDPSINGFAPPGDQPGIYSIRCEVLANMTDLDTSSGMPDTVAWTDRLLNGNSDFQRIQVDPALGPPYVANLQYRPDSKPAPFGGIPNPNLVSIRLLFSPWCADQNSTPANNSSYIMPATYPDLGCGASVLMQVNHDKQVIDDGRSFNAWQFANACSSDGDCNRGTNGETCNVICSNGHKVHVGDTCVRADFSVYTPTVGQCYNANGANVPKVIKLENESAGQQRVRELFAKVSTGYKWSTPYYNRLPFDAANGDLPVWNFTGVGDKNNANMTANPVINPPPPTVLSVTNQCQSDGNCVEGGPGVSVQVADQSSALITQGPVVIPNSTVSIYLDFFGYADKDHMPLRQVWIQWGDGQQTLVHGKFRNQRGVLASKCDLNPKDNVKPFKGTCLDPTSDPNAPEYPGQLGCNQNSDCPKLNQHGGPAVQMTCDFNAPLSGSLKQYHNCYDPGTIQTLPGKPISCKQDSDCPVLSVCSVPGGSAAGASGITNFGTILNQTCDENYFQFFHSYQCAKSSPEFHKAGEKDAGGNTICPTDGSFPNGCCAFNPGVQLKDNWGWCNGANAGQAYYDGNGKDGNGKSANACTGQPSAYMPFSTDGSNAIIVAPQ